MQKTAFRPWLVLALWTLPSMASAAETAAAPGGRDLALCVGINNYVLLGKLNYCVNDAYAVKKRLEESRNFRRVTVLSDVDEQGAPQLPGFQPTENTILSRLEQLARVATPDDRLVFFFSGHGVDRAGESCIVPVDGNEATAIPLAKIKAVMAKSRARHKLLIVDACRSGGGIKGMAGVRAPLEDRDIGMLVSCGAEQFSFEDAASGRSLFTLVLEEALAGAADYDDDGVITGAELHRYLDNGMGDYFLENDILFSQTPEISESAMAMPFLRIDKQLMARREREAAEKREEERRESERLAELERRQAEELARREQELEEKERKLRQAETNRLQFESTVREAENHFKAERYRQAVDRFDVALGIEGYENDSRAIEGKKQASEKQREEYGKQIAASALTSAKQYNNMNNYSQALPLFKQAAEAGIADAQLWLGIYHYDGKGVNVDYYKAFQYFQLAANQGNANAQGWLGQCYRLGHGVAQSYAESLKWNLAAAEQGNVNSMFSVGLRYRHGQGVPQDLNEALRWVRMSADRGNDEAMRQLAIMYDNGIGVPENYYEAARWIKKSADLGNVKAQHDVGHFYYNGKGGLPRDHSEAARYFRMSPIHPERGETCDKARRLLGY